MFHALGCSCRTWTLAGVKRVERREPFDLDRVTKRVAKKHRPLLAGLAGKAQLWWQDKVHLGIIEALGQGLPVGQRQHQTKVRHRHQMVANLAGGRRLEGLSQVHRELVAKKVKVNPGVGAAALFATQNAAVEGACLVQVGDVEGKVKEVFHAWKDSRATGTQQVYGQPRLTRKHRANAIIRNMNPLHFLRNAPWLAKLALLWFALTLGVAVASPLVHPQNELVICTGAGMLKVVLADDGTVTTAATSDTGDALFCPLCMVGGAPAPVVVHTVEPPHALSHVLQSIPAARLAARTAAPLPARGPPAL